MSLSTRLTTLAASVVAMAAILPPVLLAFHVREAHREAGAEASRRLQQDLALQVEAWRGQLAREASRLAGMWAERAEGSRIDDAALQQAAMDAVSGGDVDFLWVVDDAGGIRACGHWPARQGGRAGVLAALADGRPHGTRVVVGDADVAALLVAVPFNAAESGQRLVAGLNLEQAVGRASPPLSATRLSVMPGSDTPSPEEGAGSDLFARVPVDAGSLQGLHIVAHQRRSPADPLALGLLQIALLAAGMALVLALGLGVLIRRTLQPLDHLNEMAAALSQGRLDFELGSRRQDALGSLADSFDRMLRSLRRQRRELETTSRLAAWRDAARRMAHEVRNPLAPIRMSVENLMQARKRAPQQFESLFAIECQTILEEVDALNRLVESFSRFARLPEPRRSHLPALEPLRHVLQLCAPAAGGVVLRERSGPDPGSAWLDRELIGQVLKNLTLNALQAVPHEGGRVELGCERRGDRLHYTVADNGPGIPAAIQPRIFEPQVSAHPGGSGLGLAVCRQIVMAHGGTIGFTTSGEGTTFDVTLSCREEVGGDS